EMGARSISPERRRSFSSVGTPGTSSTAASSPKKIGAMFTYEMRPRRITWPRFGDPKIRARRTGRGCVDPPPCSRSAYFRLARACATVRNNFATGSRGPPPEFVVERVALHRGAAGRLDDPHELLDLLLGLG